MKTSLLLISTFLIWAVGYTQITVVNSDMPASGDTIYYGISNISGFNPSQTGPAYVWDFSTLSPISHRSDTFLTVFQTPVAYNVIFNFLVANLACINQTPPSLGIGITVTESYDFFKNTSSNYRKAGFGAQINGIPTPIKYDNPELYYTFPLNYNNTDSSTSTYGLTIPTYGYFGQKINRKYFVDGWGTLIIPYGTFQVLRVKTTINISDTIFSESLQFGYTINRPTSYEYYWIANNLHGHALKVSQTGMLYSAEYLDSLYYTSISDSPLNSAIEIFPNPAETFIHIKNCNPESKVLISLIDFSGKLIFEKQLNQSECNINTSDIPAGFYFLKTTSSFGNKIYKLTIIH
jgi:hypothetical protein